MFVNLCVWWFIHWFVYVVDDQLRVVRFSSGFSTFPFARPLNTVTFTIPNLTTHTHTHIVSLITIEYTTFLHHHHRHYVPQCSLSSNFYNRHSSMIRTFKLSISLYAYYLLKALFLNSKIDKTPFAIRFFYFVRREVSNRNQDYIHIERRRSVFYLFGNSI